MEEQQDGAHHHQERYGGRHAGEKRTGRHGRLTWFSGDRLCCSGDGGRHHSSHVLKDAPCRFVGSQQRHVQVQTVRAIGLEQFVLP
jgi:hypothetical protein